MTDNPIQSEIREEAISSFGIDRAKRLRMLATQTITEEAHPLT